MKNRLKITRITVLVMVILGLSLVTINASAQGANSLEGVWAVANVRLEISGNSFSVTFTDTGKGTKGTYTVNGNDITFKADARTWGSYETKYSFTDYGSLYFEHGKGRFWWYGTFLKVDTELRAYRAITADSRTTPLEGIWMHMNHYAGNARFVFSGNSFSYTWNGGEKKGLFTLDGNKVSLHADDGTSWITEYSINPFDVNNWDVGSDVLAANTDSQNIALVLANGSGSFHFWGWFARVNTNSAIEGTWKRPPNNFHYMRTGYKLEDFYTRPLPRELDATITFSGNTFRYNHYGLARSGTFEIKDDRILLTSRRRVVREYYYSFYDNGSRLFLWGASGDEREYYDGLFDKQ